MLYLTAQCPHCNESSGLEIFALSSFKTPSEMKTFLQAQTSTPIYTSGKETQAAIFVAGVCVHCDQPVLVELEVYEGYVNSLFESIKYKEKQYCGEKPTIKRMYPQPPLPYSHPALPDKIRLLFVDLQIMLTQNFAPSLVITGCRSVLEEAVKQLGGQGEKLHHRIADLKEKAVLNGVLHELAFDIKNLGNETVHELSGTRDAADELVEFTKLFLQYTFEFPARIVEFRRKR